MLTKIRAQYYYCFFESKSQFEFLIFTSSWNNGMMEDWVLALRGTFSNIPLFQHSKKLKSEICVFFEKFVKLLSSENNLIYHLINHL